MNFLISKIKLKNVHSLSPSNIIDKKEKNLKLFSKILKNEFETFTSFIYPAVHLFHESKQRQVPSHTRQNK